jgi:excisionase family DNA binding protein
MNEQDLTPLAHTVLDACKRLGISRTLLYVLISAGAIRTFKVGARTLVPESELRKFVADKMDLQRSHASSDNHM